jgi:hypothetical protein
MKTKFDGRIDVRLKMIRAGFGTPSFNGEVFAAALLEIRQALAEHLSIGEVTHTTKEKSRGKARK